MESARGECGEEISALPRIIASHPSSDSKHLSFVEEERRSSTRAPHTTQKATHFMLLYERRRENAFYSSALFYDK